MPLAVTMPIAIPAATSTSGSSATCSATAGLTPAPLKSSETITRSPPKSWFTISSTDALIEAPKVVKSATTAVPIISAEALPAVRRGSRMAFRRASRPVWPRRRLGTYPNTPAAGRATTGPRTTAPTSVSSAPSPARPSGWSAIVAVATVAIPRAVSTMPPINRLFEAEVESTADSRKAASGAIREARRAGRKLASRVEPTPTTMAMTTVLVAITTPSKPRSKPALSMMALSPTARPYPTARPASDAMVPITIASPTTEVSTWRRDAPSARSSADSRLRWAMRIENVLWMLNEATTRAMTAKASRMVLNMPRNSPSMSAIISSVSSAPVSASALAGSAAAMSSRSSSWLTPSSAATRIDDTSPGRPTSSAAATSVNAV